MFSANALPSPGGGGCRRSPLEPCCRSSLGRVKSRPSVKGWGTVSKGVFERGGADAGRRGHPDLENWLLAQGRDLRQLQGLWRTAACPQPLLHSQDCTVESPSLAHHLPPTHSSSSPLSLLLSQGKDLVSEQTLQIQEAPEAELWRTGRGLPWETPLLVSLLPAPSIPLGSAQGRGPAHRWLRQQLWSLVSASLPRCPGSISDDVRPGKGGSGPHRPQSPERSSPAPLLVPEETSSRWGFSSGQGVRGEQAWGGVLSPLLCNPNSLIKDFGLRHRPPPRPWTEALEGESLAEVQTPPRTPSLPSLSLDCSLPQPGGKTKKHSSIFSSLCALGLAQPCYEQKRK